ncbi:MAG: type II toxin-antitoxin system VapB family antitoxin [Thermomicrobiales bacterium]
MPTLNIKDEEIHRMAKALAEAHRTSMTEEVRQAVRERYDRIEPKANSKAGLVDWIKEFTATLGPAHKSGDPEFSQMIDELLYDENGLPK